MAAKKLNAITKIERLNNVQKLPVSMQNSH